MVEEKQKPKCPYCGCDQLDLISFNMDAVKCRRCGHKMTGLELLEQQRKDKK